MTRSERQTLTSNLQPEPLQPIYLRSKESQTGTAARKKGASTNQYVDQLSGEPARRQACRSLFSKAAASEEG